MQKKYEPPYIETVQLRQSHIMVINGSNIPDNVNSLDTDALKGEQQTESNTLIEGDTFL